MTSKIREFSMRKLKRIFTKNYWRRFTARVVNDIVENDTRLKLPNVYIYASKFGCYLVGYHELLML